MMSLRTDFETHAKWKGYIEEPTAKDFIARKVRTIELNKVHGTNWNVIKCEEHLGSHPEDAVRLGATNARGVGREQRGNLRGGCMSKLCVE
jgi:hypothetical protein